MVKMITFWFAQSFLITTIYPALIASGSILALAIGIVVFICNVWAIYKYFDRPVI